MIELLKEYVKQSLLMEYGDPATMFRNEMSAMFYRGKDGSLVEKFPNNCEVKIRFRDHVDPNTVRFDYIETTDQYGHESDECYRKGYARSVMDRVVTKADLFGITLSLEVSPYREAGATFDDLYKFYSSVGFVPGDSYGEMIREPK